MVMVAVAIVVVVAVGRGRARQGGAWHGRARQGRARQGAARRDSAWRGGAWLKTGLKLMTIYVDDMYRSAMGRFGRMKMSHMIADSDDELHAMADKIGVARKWFQGNHYDISMSKRVEAIRHGAVPISLRELAQMVKEKRRQLVQAISGGDPELTD